jgi:hypothetical protein
LEIPEVFEMSIEVQGNVATYVAGEALVGFRRVKLNSSRAVVYSDAGEEWIGITTEAVANGNNVGVRLKNGPGTFKMMAAGAYSILAVLYGADDGKVDDVASGLPVGRALEAATADGDVAEVSIEGEALGDHSLDMEMPSVEIVASSVGKGIPFLINFRPAAAGTFAYTVPAAKKLRVIAVLDCVKTGGNGAHASDEVQLFNDTDAITDKQELGAVNEDAIFNFTTFDATFQDVVATETLNVVALEDAANGCDCIIPVLCMWVTP